MRIESNILKYSLDRALGGDKRYSFDVKNGVGSWTKNADRISDDNGEGWVIVTVLGTFLILGILGSMQ